MSKSRPNNKESDKKLELTIASLLSWCKSDNDEKYNLFMIRTIRL